MSFKIQFTTNRDLCKKGCFLNVSKIVFFILCFFQLGSSGVVAADGISWGRFWFQPELGLSEKYSDNIFHDLDNAKDDYITTILPKLSGRLAFTSDSNLGLNYKGNFTQHSNFDNFGSSNQGDITWSLYMPAGSNIKIGASIQDTSIQPYSESDREKSYLTKTAFADTALKIGSFTEIGMRYEYRIRQFDNTLDEEDNYDRNSFKIDFVNRYLPRFPFLFEYRYAINNRENNPSSNSRSNAIYAGARWTPETRLSGNLRIGYQYTDYDEIDDVSIIVADTTLSYKLTDMTTLRLEVVRTLKDSISVDIKESGNNYAFTTLEGHVSYRYSDPLKLSLQLRCQNRDYDKEEDREDNLYSTRVAMDYSFYKWVALSFAYKYQENISNRDWAEYKENSVYAGVSFSL